MSTILHGNKACARFEISISSHMRVGGKASEEILQREKITLDPKTCLHSHEILLHQIASYLISVRCRLAPSFLTQFPFFGIISSSASKQFHSSSRCMRGKKARKTNKIFYGHSFFARFPSHRYYLNQKPARERKLLPPRVETSARKLSHEIWANSMNAFAEKDCLVLLSCWKF